jgi:hypothetical protein
VLFSLEKEQRSVCKWTFREKIDPTKQPNLADHCSSFVKFYRPIVVLVATQSTADNIKQEKSSAVYPCRKFHPRKWGLMDSLEIPFEQN